MTQAVVYLARGVDGGEEKARIFLDSYEAHPAGAAHELVILAKGGWTDAALSWLGRRAQALSARVLSLDDDGYDWGAYFRAERQLEHEWLLFLNTSSRLLSPGWLNQLRSVAERPGVGMVGATGSWESRAGLSLAQLRAHLAEVWSDREAMFGVTAVRDFAFGRFVNGRRFPLFPNPHLRSNAFLVRHSHFHAYADQQIFPNAKLDAYFLESGPTSFTRFLKARGLRSLVVGADGAAYEEQDWPESGTLRAPGQPNLLVSDNQTQHYVDASRTERRLLERLTWGRAYSS